MSIRTELNLSSHKTIWNFMCSDKFVRVVVGPIGSGKSTGVGCGEIMRRALLQDPSPVDNIRYFKALVVRNTLPDLRRTTIETWKAMYPETIGKFHHTQLWHHIKMPARRDQPGLDLRVEFVGLDKEVDVRKLLSWEGTLIWFNEGKEIHKDIIDQSTGRVGRYPSMMQGGVMPNWQGIVIDTNPYEDKHWLAELEKQPPSNWEFFRQPPAVFEMQKVRDGYESIEEDYNYFVSDENLIHGAANTLWSVNPKAENLFNLSHADQDPLRDGAYYPRILGGKDRKYIEVYVQGKNGTVTRDKRVIPEFDYKTMVTDDPMYQSGLPLQCGVDFGAGTLNPAAVFGQFDPIYARWYIVAELACPGMALLEFADQLIITISEKFEGRSDIRFYGDPSGMQRDGVENRTYFDHLISKGIIATPAPTNAKGVRIECIKAPMLRFYKGLPGFLVNIECSVLIDALLGKWYYRRLNVMNESRYDENPYKNHPYSDIADALGYLLSSGNEYNSMVMRENAVMSEVHIASMDWDVYK